MANYTNGSDIPIGFGMELAKNNNAMSYFASQSKQKQRQMIEHASGVSSKEEMAAYVRSFTDITSFH